MRIKCKKSNVALEDNILFVDVADEIEFTIEDYRDTKHAAFKLANRKPVYTLIKLGFKTLPDSAVRELCTIDTAHGFIKAEAFVVNTLGQRIVADHLLKRKRKRIPVRLFTCPEKARNWLKSLQQRDMN